MESLLQSVESQICHQSRRRSPADNASSKDIDHKGHVSEATPGSDVRQIRDPELVRAHRAEVAIHKIRRSIQARVWGRGLEPTATHGAMEAHILHQSSYGAASHGLSLAAKLAPHRPHAVHAEVLPVDPTDLEPKPVVALGAFSSALRISLPGLVLVVRRRSDRQHCRRSARPRKRPSMIIDEGHVIVSVGGRAPPGRKTPKPCEGSRSPASAHDSPA